MAINKVVSPHMLVGANIQVLDGLVDDTVLIYTPGTSYAVGDTIRTDENKYYSVNVDGVLDDTNFDANTTLIVITEISSGGRFTSLADTPASYSGNAGYFTVVKQDESGLEFKDVGDLDFKTTFLELNDTPNEYTGAANNIVVVNETEDGLKFSTFDPSSGVISVNGQTGVVVLTALDVGARPDTWNPVYDDILNVPSEFPPSAHDHNSQYYTKSEIDTMLVDKADVGHTHTEYALLTGASFTGSISTTGNLTVSQNIDVDGNIAAKGDITGFYGTYIKKLGGK